MNRLPGRARSGSLATGGGQNDHFYVPSIIDADNPNQSVSDNLDSIQSTLLNFNRGYNKKMEELDAAIAKLQAFEPFPIGSVYIATDAVNPRDKFGYGNWQLTSAGRALVGAGGGKVLGQTGGSATAALTLANMPAHKHDVAVANFSGARTTTTNGGTKTTSSAGAHAHNSYLEGTVGVGFPATVVKPAAINVFSSQTVTSPTMTTEGSHTHTVNIDHNHSVDITHGHTVTENSKGSGAAFNIENPYFVVNIWYRVS